MQEIKMSRPKSCSICSIAMLAGVSFDEAVRLALKDGSEDFSMSLDDMVLSLIRAGLKTNLLPRMPENVTHDMLCECRSKSKRYWHYIVYDASAKRFIDPAPSPPPIDDYKFYRCVEIL